MTDLRDTSRMSFFSPPAVGVLWACLVVGLWPAGSAVSHPPTVRLWEHFFNDGCSLHSPGNLTSQLPLERLADEDGFLLELGIYGIYTPMIIAGEDTCALPFTSLYLANITEKNAKKVTFTFTKVPDEGEGEDDGKVRQEAGEDAAVCILPWSSWLVLKGGYGFVSCRGLEDRAQTLASLRAWRKEVLEVEAKKAATKTKILAGLGAGMTVLLLSCAVCVLLRLRTIRRPVKPVRRPSQQSSIRTRATELQSSTQHTSNKCTD